MECRPRHETLHSRIQELPGGAVPPYRERRHRCTLFPADVRRVVLKRDALAIRPTIVSQRRRCVDAKPSLTTRSRLRAACLAATMAAFAACEGAARFPVSAGIGPVPALPPPDRGLFPAIEIAEAKGWPSG